MNKKNNLGKISIPFSLLSIFLVSCGKNTPTIETTHQNLKTTFSLNVTPSANYIAQPDTQTIVIPESGCVILNSSVSTNNNKKDMSFNNINLQSNVLEHFQLDNKTQTLCHLGILQPNEPDTAELVLNSDNESSETYKIEVAKHNLPTLSLNSFEQNNSFKVFNFSFEINNKKHPLNPKLYNIKFLSQDGNTIAFVPENSIKVLDYNNNNIGTIQKLNDGSTQISLINNFNLKIDSIVIGHKNSITANKYIIRDNNKTINYMLSGYFFANEISTRESLFKKKIDALEKSFSEELRDNLNNFFLHQINSIKTTLNQTIEKLSTLENNFKNKISPKIQLLEEQISNTSNTLNSINEKLNRFNFLSSQINSNFLNEVSLAVKNLSAIIRGTSTPILRPGVESLINEIKQSLLDSSAAKEEITALNELNNVINSNFEALTNKLIEMINNRIVFSLNRLSALDAKPNVDAIISNINYYNYHNINVLIDDLNNLVTNNPSDSGSPYHFTEEDLVLVNEIISELSELQDLSPQ